MIFNLGNQSCTAYLSTHMLDGGVGQRPGDWRGSLSFHTYALLAPTRASHCRAGSSGPEVKDRQLWTCISGDVWSRRLMRRILHDVSLKFPTEHCGSFHLRTCSRQTKLVSVSCLCNGSRYPPHDVRDRTSRTSKQFF
jgi:hypothetical protein